MEKDFELFRRLSVFAGMEDGEIQSILEQYGRGPKTFGQGEYILRQGERQKAMGVLLSGSLFVVQEDLWGHRNLLAQLCPGELFAESFACARTGTLNVSVVGNTPGEFLFLDIGRLLSSQSRPLYGKLLKNLIYDLAGKTLRLNDKITHMGKRSTREKLLSYLTEESIRKGSLQFQIPFNRQQLADYLSVERSAMSAELARLKKEGILSYNKNCFALHQLP